MKFEQGDLIVSNEGNVGIVHAIEEHNPELKDCTMIQSNYHYDNSDFPTIDITIIKNDNWEILEKDAFKNEFSDDGIMV